jgi:hypothetical protein
MSFNNGDRVRSRNGIGLVGIVSYRIEVPPPRWEENGVTQISYAISYPTIGSQTILDEDNIVLVENPLI